LYVVYRKTRKRHVGRMGYDRWQTYRIINLQGKEKEEDQGDTGSGIFRPIQLLRCLIHEDKGKKIS
jgi:hypothetical protein